MKSVLATLFAALVLGASPAWAGHGHGHGKHHAKHWQKHQKHHRHHKHWAQHHRHQTHVVHQYYYAPPPPVVYAPRPRVVEYRHVVVPASPPPGIHVVMPNIYVPF